MIRLITPQRIVELTFTNNVSFDMALINDAIIEAAQLRWIKPVLGNDLWDEIEEQYPSSYSATNQTLIDKLEKPLAFFIKAELIPDMCINTTSSGLQVIKTDYSQPASDKQRGQLQDQAIQHGKSLLEEVVRWIEKDANIVSYPLYYTLANVNNNITRKGGLLL
jgi:hypothetical protein